MSVFCVLSLFTMQVPVFCVPSLFTLQVSMFCVPSFITLQVPVFCFPSLFSLQMPVFRGAEVSLLETTHEQATQHHGSDGLGNVDNPAYAVDVSIFQKQHAVNFLLHTVDAHPGKMCFVCISHAVFSHCSCLCIEVLDSPCWEGFRVHPVTMDKMVWETFRHVMMLSCSLNLCMRSMQSLLC